MTKFFQNRANERHRKMFAQSLANEEWDSVRSLLEQNPGIAKRSHCNGWSLLHSLVYHPGTPNSLIRMVATIDRRACTVQNPIAETPLHLCCDRARPDLSRIRILLECSSVQHPESLVKRDTFGRTSFFLACANDVPLDILKAFVYINPQVAIVRDIFGEHPLECLLCRLGDKRDPTKHESSMEKFTFLAMEAWRFKPSCPWYDITKENKESYLLLAMIHIKPSLVYAVSRVCSKACLWTKDANGDLPIHAALRNPRAPRYILDELLRLAPETAKVPCRGGQLPLHLAVGRCSLAPLLQAYPEALSQMVRPNGLFPFQDAAARDEPVNVIYTLLRSKPDLISGHTWEASTTGIGELLHI